jgi:hypothetical protein
MSFLDVFTFVRVHLQQPADTFLFAGSGVEDRRTCHEHTGIYSQEGQMSEKWIGHKLECKRTQREIVGTLANNLFFGVRIGSNHRRDLYRR